VRRLRVVAASTPGSAIRETVLDAPLDTVWAVAAGLEAELPRWLFPDIRSVRVTATGGDRFEALMTGHSGLRARFEVVLRPGWCVMRSRFLLGGMAAVAEGGGTRFAVLGGFRGSLRLLTGLTRAISDRNGRQALVRFAQRVQELR
jgi:hypothetical protein